MSGVHALADKPKRILGFLGLALVAIGLGAIGSGANLTHGAKPIHTLTADSPGITATSGRSPGWTVTVSADDSNGNSSVLAQYCPNAVCGADSGPGYVPGGASLPANSLTVDSNNARLGHRGGGAGNVAAYECDSRCFLDAPASAPTKVISASRGPGTSIFDRAGFSSARPTLAAPRFVQRLPANEIYKVDLVWSLTSGP